MLSWQVPEDKFMVRYATGYATLKARNEVDDKLDTSRSHKQQYFEIECWSAKKEI